MYVSEQIYHKSRPICMGAIHTRELDRSEIDLSQKRSECERSNANWDRSKIEPIQLRSILVWTAP